MKLFTRVAAIIATLLITALAFAGNARTGAAPIVTLNPTSLDFGNQLIGTVSLPHKVTLTNTGDATLTITFMKPNPAGVYTVFSDCGTSVAPSASCTISIVFSPSVSGVAAGTMNITDNGIGSPQTVTLTGNATVPAVVIAPSTLNFGNVAVGGSSTSQIATLKNQGTTSLTITSITSNLSDFPVTNTCPPSLTAGQSCTLTVTFTPTVGGTRLGNISVTDSDATSPQSLGAAGIATSGTPSFSSSSLTFAGQQVGTTSAPQTVTVTNTAATSLGIVSILASGDYAQTNTCGTSVAPGGNCTISITFTPSAKNIRTGFVTLSDTAGSSIQTITMTGTGRGKLTTVTLVPKQASLTLTQTQQFQALINGIPSTDVTWFVDNIQGGNTTVGTITTDGIYTPPATVGTHTVRARSNSDTTQSATGPIVLTNVAGVYTYHFDTLRTGQNTAETVLTTGNVNKNQFGKLIAYPVDGVLRGQPLYVANVNVAGQGFHNVVYVANEHDSVYAFDADGKVTTPLWQVSFLDASNGITTVPNADVNLNCPNIGDEFGVSETPVIDPALGRLYVLARTKQVVGSVTTYHQMLHALDITSGAEVPGSPVEIQASVPGLGEGSVNGVVAFDPLRENSRPAMLELNGVIYMAWSSICDVHPYHGWVIGYDANSLTQVSVANTSPNGQAAGIWQSAAGIAGDTSGNVYVETSNGLFNVDQGGTEYGNTVLKLNNGTVADFFTPFNATALTEVDSDMSSAGPMLLPDQTVGPPHLMLASGKEGVIYLINRDAMGHFRSTDDNQIVQSIDVLGGCADEGSLWGLQAYWQNQVYVWACGDVMRQFRLYQGVLSPTPIVVGTSTSQYPPPTPAVSSNGNVNGIVWTIYEHPFVANQAAVLFAWDAANITRKLYDSSQAGSRDRAGIASKGPVPLIVNGKVYVSTATEVDVYGLLP